MKITPIATSSGTTGESLQSANQGQSATHMKLERARAIARGEKVADVEETQTTLQERANARRIRMRTNYNTNREGDAYTETPAAAAPAADPDQAAEVAVSESSTGDVNEAGTVEDTKPLSPQLAALAKERRTLAERTKALEAREKALADKAGGEDALKQLADRIKAKPLSVLQEYGVTYDQLTEAVLSGDDSLNPDLQALRAELKATKEEFNKTLTDRDLQQRKAALTEMEREAKRISGAEDFELVRETGSIPKVMELIEKTYDESGEVLDVAEAMRLVEEELLEREVRIAALKKVQGKLAPQATTPPQRQLRTLTSSGAGAQPMSAKQRAIAAFNGTLKR